MIPPCPQCGAPRTFECQLMPYVHRLLSKSLQQQKQLPNTQDSKSILEFIAGEVDWGTVLFYTCSKDCDGSTTNCDQKVYHAPEFVAVQIETD